MLFLDDDRHLDLLLLGGTEIQECRSVHIPNMTRREPYAWKQQKWERERVKKKYV